MKYLKSYRVFENILKDTEEDYLVARSSEWALYRFKTAGDFIEFDETVSPDEPLTKGAFSGGRFSGGDPHKQSLNGLFNTYSNRFGDLFLLININDMKDLYMFNCGPETFYGGFGYDGNNKLMNREVSETLKSLDYNDAEIEKWMFDMSEREVKNFIQ